MTIKHFPPQVASGIRRCVSLSAALAAAAFGAGAFVSLSAHAADQQMIETGSSLLYPLFNLWIPEYVKAHTGLEITPQSTGSGTGISQAIDGTAQIGGSDAYLSPALAKQHATMMNIPLAISSQMVNYNLPGMAQKHLNLNGPVLALIFQGKIVAWNDAAIEKLNPGVTLPDEKIVTVHRTDGSGDTFIFTQYLSASAPEWQKSLGYGTTISWPAAPGAIGAVGNPGVVDAMKNAPYSIGYVGISFKSATESNSLGEAALENRSGKFVLSTAESVKAAADELSGKTPADESMSLIFAPGDKSYPIVNYEYAIVNAKQADAAMGTEIRAFLSWTILPEHGAAPSFLDQVSFVALPPSVEKLSQTQIDRIGRD
jgi:phosphate transport system substrate-binding protein